MRRRIQFHGRRQTSSEKFPLVSRSGNLEDVVDCSSISKSDKQTHLADMYSNQVLTTNFPTIQHVQIGAETLSARIRNYKPFSGLKQKHQKLNSRLDLWLPHHIRLSNHSSFVHAGQIDTIQTAYHSYQKYACEYSYQFKSDLFILSGLTLG